MELNKVCLCAIVLFFLFPIIGFFMHHFWKMLNTIDDYIWAIEMDDEDYYESVYYSNSCIHHHGIVRIHILKTR